MLLKITNKCLMGCSHCLDDCNPDGEYMDMQTFEKAFDFIKKLEPLVVLISGGEPTLHPEFTKIVKTIQALETQVLVLSNGMFLEDESLFNEFISLGVHFQITNDSRYYPKTIKQVNHPNLVYVSRIQSLMPIGRAKGVKTDSKPACFNLRSLVKKGNMTLYKAIKLREALFKFCKPAILTNGDIVLGESTTCKSIGNVNNLNVKDMHENIKNLKCNKCGTFNNLPQNYREVLGE